MGLIIRGPYKKFGTEFVDVQDGTPGTLPRRMSADTMRRHAKAYRDATAPGAPAAPAAISPPAHAPTPSTPAAVHTPSAPAGAPSAATTPSGGNAVRQAQAVRAATRGLTTMTDGQRLAAYDGLTPKDMPGLADAHKQAIEDDLKGLASLKGKPGQDFVSSKALLIHSRLFPATAPAAPAGPSPSAPLPAGTPAHVQHAVAIAHRSAPGAGIAKTQVPAYEKLSKAEFDALPADTQKRILDDVANAKTKFRDQKKIDAATALQARFGTPAPAGAPTAVNGAHGYSDDLVQAMRKVKLGSTGDLLKAARVLTRDDLKALTPDDRKALLSRMGDAVRIHALNPHGNTHLEEAADLHRIATGGSTAETSRKWDHVPSLGELVTQEAEDRKKAGGFTHPGVQKLADDHKAGASPRDLFDQLEQLRGSAAGSAAVTGSHKEELAKVAEEISQDQKQPTWLRADAYMTSVGQRGGANYNHPWSGAAFVAAEPPNARDGRYYHSSYQLGELMEPTPAQIAQAPRPIQDAILERRSDAVIEALTHGTTSAMPQALTQVLGNDIPVGKKFRDRYDSLTPKAKDTILDHLRHEAGNAQGSYQARLAQGRYDSLMAIKYNDEQQAAIEAAFHQSTMGSAARTDLQRYEALSKANYDALPLAYRRSIQDHLDSLGQAGHVFSGPSSTTSVHYTKARLAGTLPNYSDAKLRQSAIYAGIDRDNVDARRRLAAHLELTTTDFNHLHTGDDTKILTDLKTLANDQTLLPSERLQAQYQHDLLSGDFVNYTAAQRAAIIHADPKSRATVREKTNAYNDLSKAEFDQLPAAYRDSIDNDLPLLGQAQLPLRDKFHPPAGTPGGAQLPPGQLPVTKTSDPKIQAALDVIYGTDDKAHTIPRQLKVYTDLTPSHYAQLNANEQQQVLQDLSYVATTATGTNKTRAEKLLDRFTPAGTPHGQVPSQVPIPPVGSVPGQHRYSDPTGQPGMLFWQQDTGVRGDEWTRKKDGSRGPWGRYGAAGVMLRHTDAQGVTRYLMIERGPGISDPGKWQFPGGAIESKETPHTGAARETIEELGFPKDGLKDARVHGEHVFTMGGVIGPPGGDWHYTSIAASVPTQLKPDLSTASARAETSDAKWMTLDEIRALDRRGKLIGPLSGGAIESNVISLFPTPQQAAAGGAPARPGPVTVRPKRLRTPRPQAHKPSRGRDLVSDKADRDKLRQDVKQLRSQYDGKTHDGRLAAIGHIQGYDDTPTVVDQTEYDRLLATGDYIEVWRGVKGNGVKTGRQMNEELRSGTAYYGGGIFGNGYYFASDKDVVVGTGSGWSGRYTDGKPGSVVRALIPKQAKTIRYEDAIRQAQQHGTPRSKAKGGHSFESSTLWDAGRWAAAAGYDGIEISHTTSSAQHVAKRGKPAFNWLNRSVLVVLEDK